LFEFAVLFLFVRQRGRGRWTTGRDSDGNGDRWCLRLRRWFRVFPAPIVVV
jgi:hypothetical protein